jgi:hypothetical protein
MPGRIGIGVNLGAGGVGRLISGVVTGRRGGGGDFGAGNFAFGGGDFGLTFTVVFRTTFTRLTVA